MNQVTKRPQKLLKLIVYGTTAILFLALTFLLVFPKSALAFNCGEDVKFDYREVEVTYGTVEHNGECWLDRNLGASQIATDFDDELAYGDLFQWGREDDGHQVRSPAPDTVEGEMILEAQPGHAKFITEQTNPCDWAANSWITRWLDESGDKTDADPCPSGWRIPIETEWETERTSWVTVDENTNDYNGAFASPLKLTAAGYRHARTATLVLEGSYGFYWISAVDGTGARYLGVYSSGAGVVSSGRAQGFSVRCIYDSELEVEDEEAAVPEFTTVTLIIAAVAGFGIYFVIKRKKEKAAS